jgi:hypothetical protein
MTAVASSAARIFLALLAAAVFSSCTVYDDGYYGGGPVYGAGVGYGGGPVGGGYYDGWYDDYYDYHPPVFQSYVTFSSAWPHYYGGRYYRSRWWDDKRYWNYRHDHGSNRDRYRKRRSSEELKLVRYRGEDRGRLPTGYHSKRWYQERDYELRSNTYKTRDGDFRGYQPSRSSSQSRPDNRPTSEHPRARLQPEKYRYTGSGSRESDQRRQSEEVRRSQENRSQASRSQAQRSQESRSSGSANRSRPDDRPTSEHPRARQQPEKYRYTGGGGEDRSEKSKGKSKKN